METDLKRYQKAGWQFARENAIASVVLTRPHFGILGFHDPRYPAECLMVKVENDRKGDFVWDQCSIANGNIPESDRIWYDVGNRYGLGEAVAEWFRHNDERFAEES